MVLASFHNSYSELLNFLDALGKVDYRAVVDIAVAGSPQRIGLKERLARVAFPVFRLLVLFYIGLPKNNSAVPHAG